MARFEVTLQSAFGFVGPKELKADSADDALLVARTMARGILASDSDPRLLNHPWMLIVRDDDGEVVVTVPFYVEGPSKHGFGRA